jgi:hypothetical protein
VQGCTLALEDGELLTGKLPDHLDQNAISVFAPQDSIGCFNRLPFLEAGLGIWRAVARNVGAEMPGADGLHGNPLPEFL